jgi:NAD(P)-dependent dehydrogenase (short-subunit alcohol dehydrogenase family)
VGVHLARSEAEPSNELKTCPGNVTGSTAGIGFAIARGLAESGADVVVNGRSSARVEAALNQFSQELPKAHRHASDRSASFGAVTGNGPTRAKVHG